MHIPITQRTLRIHLAVGLTLGLLLLMLARAQPAAAASTLDPISDPGKMTLTAGDFASRWRAIDAVEASGKVTAYNSLAPLLSGSGHSGRPYLCHGNQNLNTSYNVDGFCWQQADDTTGDWVPQGITGSHDAQPDGKWLDKYVYIASWHSRNTGSDEFARISVVDNAGGDHTIYNHIMLVDPYMETQTTGNFQAVGAAGSPFAGHADGIAWYGNRLFVASGHQIQVYDLRHLWRMSDNTRESVGISDGKSSARWHNWALPMIGFYDNGIKGDPCTDLDPCMTSLSLDRTGTDALITSEFRRSTGGAPIVRWPLNAADTLLDTDGTTNYEGTVHATAGYRTPVWGVQGAATDGTYFYFSGTCPEYADRDPNDSATADLPYCIHWAKPGSAPHVLTYGPPLIQNLSWAPSSGRLWGINERIAPAPGVRSVFSLDPPN
ncbi:hypothetical protein ABT404_19020 [Streptomyces hyaluromycini]|uniref:Secreted protein n=1 Tax=Streptomyces hyaluromycini TaxID=1377993 RepID=A0ABV1WXS5_9ACTN